MESETKNTLQDLSHDLARAVEQISRSVVAINARRHLSSSGVYWRDGIIVTAAHTIRRTDGISAILPGGQTVPITFAGADPGTDLAMLKIDWQALSIPRFSDTAQLTVGHLVVAVGRGAQRGVNATLGIIGVLSGAWRTWRGGLVDQFIGLDLTLHPGVAGGPLIDGHGRVWESTPRHFPAILRSQISLDLPSRVRHARATPDALSIPARKALLPIKRYIIYAIIEIVGRGLISGLILSAAVGR